MISEQVRVRFAPSPTGPLHIGGVRTALFNYLFAKQKGGTFILRIEDTDQTRFTEGAEEYIIESLKWCGIEPDEGVSAGGPHEPYKQSERREIYKSFAQQLIDNGNAYYAFDKPEELEAIRKQYEANKQNFAYDLHTRQDLNNSVNLSEQEVNAKLNSGIPYVIRFKMPHDTQVQLHDMVRGQVSFNTNTLDDKVLYKSDGLPTYHLANVVDDHLMKISHVIRGEEWLPSLPLHALLYEALGWKDNMPQFAHLPLLLKPTGKGKLSKRDGDKLGFPVFPLEWKSAEGDVSRGYREDGYFPDAFVNMLALLGWNPGTEQEIFSLPDLVKNFSIERVGKSGARFDPEKARWFNQQYLKEKNDKYLAEQFMPLLIEKGISCPDDKLQKIVSLVKERVQFVHELWEQSYFFFNAPTNYDSKVVKKRWKNDIPGHIEHIATLIKELEHISSSYTEQQVKKYIADNELNMGAVMNALRLALVGTGKGPHLFDIIEIIGRDETISRINNIINVLGK